MSLQKQLAHLNLTGGLQKKDDQFLVIPSKLAVADNVEFDDASTVTTRGGQSKATLASVAVFEAAATARRLITNRGSAVIEADSGDYRVSGVGTSQLYNMRDTTAASPRVFTRAGMLTRREGSIHRKNSLSGAPTPLFDMNVDSAVIGTTQFTAWETRDASTNLVTVRYQMTDITTGKVIVSSAINTLLSKIRSKPRVIASGSSFALYYGTFTSGGTSFEVRRIVYSVNGTVLNAEASVITSSVAAASIESGNSYAVMFDVALSYDGASLGLVIRDVDAARTLRLRALSLSDFSTITASANVAPSATPTSLTALVSKNGATYRLHAFFSLDTTTCRAINMNQSTAALSAETTVGTGAAGSVTGRSAAIQTSDAGSITLAWDSQTATLEQSTLRLSTFTDTYGTLSECPTFSPWYIMGRIGVYNSRLYLPMAFLGSELISENTHFIIDLTSALRNVGVSTNSAPPHVVARIDYGESFRYRSNWAGHLRVAGCSATSTGLAFTYVKFEANLVVLGTYNDTQAAVSTATLDFTSQLGSEEVNGVTFLAGACPLIYDGQNVVEENFHHAPYDAIATTATAAGTYGPFPVGTVNVCFTIGWEDDAGNWHESPPSNSRSITFAGANLYYTPTLVLPPTMKPGAIVRMYRTKVLGTDTSFYLSLSSFGWMISADTDLGNNEQLYTAGGVLPNTPAPACRHVSLLQKRLVLTGCGDGTRVHWSKQSQPGYGVEFSSGDPTHQTQVPPSAGRAVGSKEIDDRLVILCESAIGVIGGQGPAPTGTAGQYSDFSTVVTDTGCSWDSPKSIVRAPDGIWFRTSVGLRHLGRSLSLTRNQDGKYAGAEVDSLVSGTVVGVHGDAKPQMRFYQSSGTCLVYDILWGQWTRFTGMANVDACYADGRFYHLSNYSTSSPLLRYTSDSVFTDVDDNNSTGQIFQAVVETPWLSFAGIQGLQRVYRMRVLGTYNSVADTSGYTVAGYYYVNKDSSTFVDSATLSLLGPGSTARLLEHHLAVQKCESMKIKMVILPSNTATVDGRVRLTDITLQVGLKNGLFKVPSSQRF